MDLTTRHYFSNGKLLLTGEYLVLNGALALSIPVNRGQSIHITQAEGNQSLEWSASVLDKPWFTAVFQGKDFLIKETSDEKMAKALGEYLSIAHRMNPRWLPEQSILRITTNLDFPREWGLGSSSTLISNLAYMADVDLFDYYFRISRGSGYDVASARSQHPILYRLKDGQPEISVIEFAPAFSDNVYFVYSGKKQSSDESVIDFMSRNKPCAEYCDQISSLTREMIASKSLSDFNRIIREHEKIMAEVLGVQPIKELIFWDFSGEIKSLGAWGGDFYLVTWEEDLEKLKNYFAGYGLQTIFRYDDFALNS
jgi:mevalonate kinase